MMKRKLIRPTSEPHDDPATSSARHGSVAIGFSRIQVCEVNLDRGPSDRPQRILDRHACMGVTRRIDDQGVKRPTRDFVNPVDDHAFVIGLATDDRELELRSERGQLRIELRKRSVAVNAGLALAEEVEVRPMDDEHTRLFTPVARYRSRLAVRCFQRIDHSSTDRRKTGRLLTDPHNQSKRA